MIKKIICYIFIITVCCFILSCGETPDQPIEPKEEDPVLNVEITDYILILGQSKEIEYNIENKTNDTKVSFNVLDNSVCEVLDGKIVSKHQGSTSIVLFIEGLDNSKKIINVTVYQLTIELSLENNQLYRKKTVEMKAVITPSLESDFVWSIDKKSLATLETNNSIATLKGDSEGLVKVSVVSTVNDLLKATCEINIINDSIAPTLFFQNQDELIINYNQEFDLMKDVKAIDDVDGDITDKVTIQGEVNNLQVGKYIVKYSVSDDNRNKTVVERTVRVVWDYPVTFIGHGGSFSGVMNSYQAFLNGVRIHGYQALECDIKQTKDGVFVTCHDDDFAGVKINSVDYDELKNKVVTVKRGGVSYTSKICTLEEYLNLCKNFKVKAVIELKSSNGISASSQSRMQALMDVIEKCEMEHDVIFLGSLYQCLEWTRNNGYEYIPCQYLVNSCESDTVLERCIKNNFDVSINIEKSNSEEWLKKYHDAGLKISTYTFSQYSTVETLQSWIDKGVDFVTVDVIKPYEVKLPTKTSDNE